MHQIQLLDMSKGIRLCIDFRLHIEVQQGAMRCNIESRE